MATNMKSLNGYGFDAAALGGKAPEYYIQPRNLLDNSDFRNPVNQRGATTYEGTWQISIDRWYINSAESTSMSITDDGIVFNDQASNRYLIQIIPKKMIQSGKQYTAAICDINGQIMIGDFQLISSGEDEIYRSVFGVRAGVAYVWAALYEGFYTADTLPPYVPKGYAAELAECQRYYVRGDAYVSTNQSGYVTVFFPATMRKTPNITTSEGTSNFVTAHAFVLVASADNVISLNYEAIADL